LTPYLSCGTTKTYHKIEPNKKQKQYAIPLIIETETKCSHTSIIKAYQHRMNYAETLQSCRCLKNAETAENILSYAYFSDIMQKITQKNRSLITALEAFKLLFNQSVKAKYLFLPSLLINQGYDKWIMRSTNSKIFATFPLKRMSFRCNQIHHCC